MYEDSDFITKNNKYCNSNFLCMINKYRNLTVYQISDIKNPLIFSRPKFFDLKHVTVKPNYL